MWCNNYQKQQKMNSFKLFLFWISFFILFCFVCNREFYVLWPVRSFFYMFCFILKLMCAINVLLLKQLFCLIITLLSWLLATENKHLSRDPQLASVTRNCQIYSMQLDTLKTGIFKLKEFMNFIIVRGDMLLNNLCSFVSPNFRFKDTHSVNVFTDPELSSSLYIFTNNTFSTCHFYVKNAFDCLTYKK